MPEGQRRRKKPTMRSSRKGYGKKSYGTGSSKKRVSTRRVIRVSMRKGRRVGSSMVRSGRYVNNGKYGSVVKTQNNLSQGPSSQTTDVIYSKSRLYKNDRLKYLSTMKDILSSPKILQAQGALQIANIGHDRYGKCTWYAWPSLSLSFIEQALRTGCDSASIDSVLPNYEVYIERATQTGKFYNSYQHRVQLDCWKCVPRRGDINVNQDGTQYTLEGVDPTYFVAGFNNTQTADQVSAIMSDNYGSSPFLSTSWCRTFKLTKLFSNTLNPGDSHTVRTNLVRGFKTSKAKYGVIGSGAGTAISDVYDMVKDQGCMYLMRIQGTPVHQEFPAVPVPISNNDGNVRTVTMGCYSIDVSLYSKMYIRAPQTLPQYAAGQTSQFIQSITGAGLPSSYTGYVNSTQFNTYAPELVGTN